MNLTRTSSPALLESIRVIDGRLPLLRYHQERVDRSRRMFYAKSTAFKLEKVIRELPLPARGCHKLRLEYGAQLLSYTITPYEVQPIRSLRIVHADQLRYGKKFADRAAIAEVFARRGDCDDVIIVQHNHLTDASYANLALNDGKHWYTPAWPLLRGTRRASLIEAGTIRPAVIRLRDLPHFREVRLINAMREWQDSPTVPHEAIRGLQLPDGGAG